MDDGRSLGVLRRQPSSGFATLTVLVELGPRDTVRTGEGGINNYGMRPDEMQCGTQTNAQGLTASDDSLKLRTWRETHTYITSSTFHE